MASPLQGKKIAFLATDGVEQVELTRPWEAIKNAGATVELISLKSGKIQGVHHDEKGDMFEVDKTVEQASSSNYDGLVLPGGVFIGESQARIYSVQQSSRRPDPHGGGSPISLVRRQSCELYSRTPAMVEVHVPRRARISVARGRVGNSDQRDLLPRVERA